MTYLIKFDEIGRKGETYPIDNSMTKERKAELINKGFIETSEEDFILYIQQNGGSHGTGYVRGKDGKPTEAPPYIPTKNEAARQLYAECAYDLQAIDMDILQAIAVDDDELLAELKKERVERVEQYKKDLEDLEGKVWQE